MRIGVDIDDVIFPWYEYAHELCVQARITNGVTPMSWSPFLEYGCTIQDWLDVLEVATMDGTLYSGEPYLGAIEALWRLRDAGHEVHLVTARGFFNFGELIREQTVSWLADWDVPHDSLTFTKDKTSVPCDVFIDDSAPNVAALTAAGVRTFMLTRPHNATDPYELRVGHVAEFVDLILAEGRL
jgi:hypothetical protein